MDEIICDCKVFFDIDDVEEELTSVEFLRIVRLLPSYEGALLGAVKAWAKEHEAELEDMQNAVKEASQTERPALSLSADQLRSNPKLGAAPAAGQGAPIFDVRSF